MVVVEYINTRDTSTKNKLNTIFFWMSRGKLIKFYIKRDCSALSMALSSSLSESDDSVSDRTPRWRGTLEEMWVSTGEDAGGMGSARSTTAWTDEYVLRRGRRNV